MRCAEEGTDLAINGSSWRRSPPGEPDRSTSAGPAGETYRDEFITLTTPHHQPIRWLRTEMVVSARPPRSALRADLGGGYLQAVRVVVSVEMFGDVLSMAERLHEDGFHHAAAFLGGAVLEDALRRVLMDRGAKATGNLESMNQVALDSKLYGPTAHKQVRVWIDVLDAADHGSSDEVSADRVGSFLRDLPGFMVRDLGLP